MTPMKEQPNRPLKNQDINRSTVRPILIGQATLVTTVATISKIEHVTATTTGTEMNIHAPLTTDQSMKSGNTRTDPTAHNRIIEHLKGQINILNDAKHMTAPLITLGNTKDNQTPAIYRGHARMTAGRSARIAIKPVISRAVPTTGLTAKATTAVAISRGTPQTGEDDFTRRQTGGRSTKHRRQHSNRHRDCS